MTRRPYIPRPAYSGIGRLRLALARGAYIAEAIVGRRDWRLADSRREAA